MNFLVKIASKIGYYHSRFFKWIGTKAETSKIFAVLLTLYALYEIGEHILVPVLAYMWATGKISF